MFAVPLEALGAFGLAVLEHLLAAARSVGGGQRPTLPERKLRCKRTVLYLELLSHSQQGC